MPPGAWAARHVPGTVWDLDSPALLAATMPVDVLVHRALQCFPTQFFPAPLVQAFAEQVHPTDLSIFVMFPLYASAHGKPMVVGGLDLDALHTKRGMHAAAGRQFKSPGASKAEECLLPMGLSPDAHVAAAAQLSHPFVDARFSELDSAFSLEGAARMGPDAGAWRNRVWSNQSQARL